MFNRSFFARCSNRGGGGIWENLAWPCLSPSLGEGNTTGVLFPVFAGEMVICFFLFFRAGRKWVGSFVRYRVSDVVLCWQSFESGIKIIRLSGRSGNLWPLCIYLITLEFTYRFFGAPSM